MQLSFPIRAPKYTLFTLSALILLPPLYGMQQGFTSEHHLDFSNFDCSKELLAAKNKEEADAILTSELSAFMGEMMQRYKRLVLKKVLTTTIIYADTPGTYKLLSLGAPVDQISNYTVTMANGSAITLTAGTPLHLAARCGTPEQIALLLGAGANPAVYDADGKAPLHHAVIRMAEHSHSMTPADTKKMFALLADGVGIDYPTQKTKMSALALLVKNYHSEYTTLPMLLRPLLTLGANPNKVQEAGQSPSLVHQLLNVLDPAKNFTAIKILYQYGADSDFHFWDGNTRSLKHHMSEKEMELLEESRSNFLDMLYLAREYPEERAEKMPFGQMYCKGLGVQLAIVGLLPAFAPLVADYSNNHQLPRADLEDFYEDNDPKPVTTVLAKFLETKKEVEEEQKNAHERTHNLLSPQQLLHNSTAENVPESPIDLVPARRNPCCVIQ